MSELNLPQIAESQALAYVTSNDADARLEKALCDSLAVTVPPSGNFTLTEEQFQTAWRFRLEGSPAAAFDLILPSVSRPFLMDNQSGMTVTVKIEGGAATPVLDTETRLLYSDGVNITALSDTSGSSVSASHSGALVLLASDQTVSSGPSNVLLDWGAESYDTDGFYDSSSSTERFTIPSGVNKIILSCQVRWDNNASGVREILAYKNGSAAFDGRPFTHSEAQTARTMQHFLSPVLPVTAGDYFEVFANQNSGSDRTIESHVSSWFCIQAVG